MAHPATAACAVGGVEVALEDTVGEAGALEGERRHHLASGGDPSERRGGEDKLLRAKPRRP